MNADRHSAAAGAAFDRRMISFRRSWEWALPEFRDDFSRLRRTGDFSRNGSAEVIWQTTTKYVLKFTTGSGRRIVYKTYERMRSLRYMLFHTSPLVNEALNYRLIGDLGMPLPKLLAVGERRRFFWLESGYLVTEFADGFRNGMDFMPRGVLGGERLLRLEFCRRNLRRLARIHDAGIFHRGFNPGNLLWRRLPEQDADGNHLELLWIDLANCRRRPRFLLRHGVIHDLVMFFRYFDFTAAERRELMREYHAAAQRPLHRLETLVALVEKMFKRYPPKY